LIDLGYNFLRLQDEDRGKHRGAGSSFFRAEQRAHHLPKRNFSTKLDIADDDCGTL
jgi:hypothetical protein